VADITITQPFKIVLKRKCWVEPLGTNKARIKATASGIVKWEYVVGGTTYTLPTGGSASSTAGTDSANLDGLLDTDTGSEPTLPYVVGFNTGTVVRVPSSGNPYSVEIRDVSADMVVTGASQAATYSSGGTLLLDAGGSVNGPQHPA
jgi:hypothetical protein